MPFGLAGWGFILCATGIITLIIVLAQSVKARSFARHSQSVTAKVTGKHVHYANNNRHYSLDVEYSVDGITYKRSVASVSSEYNSLQSGVPLELRYKPQNPKKIIRADSLTAKSMKTLGIVAIIFAVITVAGVVLLFAGRM